MKKVIELLERAEGAIMLATAGKPDSSDLELCTDAINYINDAMALLQSPRWETPEQREKRTGEPWPDDWVVYCRYRCNGYSLQGKWHGETYSRIKNEEYGLDQKQIVCATEAGPPPDNWRPE
jgi:hypothetical protein